MDPLPVRSHLNQGRRQHSTHKHTHMRGNRPSPSIPPPDRSNQTTAPGNTLVRAVDFVTGSVSMETLPERRLPEVCFIGRCVSRCGSRRMYMCMHAREHACVHLAG